jgi:hypothetical protein
MFTAEREMIIPGTMALKVDVAIKVEPNDGSIEVQDVYFYCERSGEVLFCRGELLVATKEGNVELFEYLEKVLANQFDDIVAEYNSKDPN